MTRRWLLVTGLVGVLIGPARAQAPLTEVEQLKLELLRTRTRLAQTLVELDAAKAALGAAHETIGKLRAEHASLVLTAEEATLKDAVEAARPGFTWNPKTGQFTPKDE